MGVLISRLFVDTPPDVNQRLEACATGKPTEVSTHFTVNTRGDHILFVKKALADYKDRHPDENIKDFVVNSEYDKDFATAIGQFKATRKPPLTNFAGKIDEIVGIKTIRALDKSQLSKREVDPSEVLPPVPPPTKRIKRFSQREFTTTETIIEDQKHDKSDFGLIEDGIFEFLTTFGDKVSIFGPEDMDERRTIVVDDDAGINEVLITIRGVETQKAQVGVPTIVVSVTTTTINYVYGRPNPRVAVTHHNIAILDGEELRNDTRTEFIDRRTAELNTITNPPLP